MKPLLIVEDDIETQAWLGAALTEAFPDMPSRCAATVADALELIANEAFEIAVVDLGLPDASGLKVLEALYATPTVCIVLTVYDDARHIFPALRAGAQGYLLKDVTRKQFVRQMRTMAAGEPPLSPSVSRKLLAWFDPRKQAAEETQLTDREKEVLALVAKGMTLDDVADLLNIRRHTVATHIKNIYRKLSISNRAEAVAEASRLGLIGL
ncbi:MAG: response regulator transcription factor [Pseudomonadota bacterium]|nr:response regulator transcription factor [Pseudomonadota bacterium]